VTLRHTKHGINVTNATPAELKEIGAPFLVDLEIADLLRITTRVGPGYFYLDRTKDADDIRRVQAFQRGPAGGAA
jgi:hypothetical protein